MHTNYTISSDEQNYTVGDSIGEEELLDLYLSMNSAERHRAFADTARTARIVGVTRRTIQLWIDNGAISALSVGRKYQVFLPTVRRYLQRCMRDN